MVGHLAGSGITVQHEIADIAKTTRKLTFSGGFLLVDELYALYFSIFNPILHSTYMKDFMTGYIFSSFRYANYTKSILHFANDLQQCLHQFHICWQNDELNQHRIALYE